MTKELWLLVLQNLIMGFAFLIPLAFARIADIGLGIGMTFKIEDLTFDKNKFLNSILSLIIIIASLGFLIASLSMIPYLLDYYKVLNINLEDTVKALDVSLVVAIFVLSWVSYGKDAIKKAKIVLGVDKIDVEQPVSDNTIATFDLDEFADAE